MINWGPGITVPQAYQFAEEASGKITDLLRHGLVEGASKPMLDSAASAITLANEKVYNPYLLLQKKTYAGFKYTLKSNKTAQSLDDFDTSVDMKGIDAVRRDRSKLVKHLSQKVLDALLIHSNLELAVQEIKDMVALVAAQKAPLDLFVLSKSLKTTYASENQPHVQAWRRMIERGDNDIPDIGTRMPYIITVAKGRAGPLYERTEHPDWVRKSGLKYCAKYYLENAQDVILRLLGPTGSGPRISQFFSDALVAAETKVAGNMSLLSFKKSKI
jgi:DNA polymerase elongation subunit (family B)